MMARIPRHLIGVGLIIALASGLYLPFSGSPPIFDDIVLFSGEKFFYYATHPFGFEPRVVAFERRAEGSRRRGAADRAARRGQDGCRGHQAARLR